MGGSKSRLVHPDANSSDTQTKSYKVEYEDWLNLIASLKSNSNILDYVNSKKRSDLESIDNLIQHLKDSPTKTVLEQAWCIYVWMCHNISFDLQACRSKSNSNTEPLEVFKNGKTVCDGFANLYKHLCDSVGIECKTVNGYSKQYGYTPIFRYTNHTWNIVKIDDKYYNVDSTLGAGTVDIYTPENQTIFNPYYFLTPPELFALTHMAENEKDQLLNKSITFDEYLAPTNPFSFHYYIFRLKTERVKSSIETETNPFFIEFNAPKEIQLECWLYDEKKNWLNDHTFVQRDLNSNKYGVFVFLPLKDKEYSLEFRARYFGDENYHDIVKYSLVHKSEHDKLPVYPNYQLEFNNGIKCLSNKSLFINTDKMPIFIEFSMPNNTAKILGSLKIFNENNKFSFISGQTVYEQKSSLNNNSSVIVVIPDYNAVYSLDVSAQLDDKSGFTRLTSFLLYKCSKTVKIDYNFPKYQPEFNMGVACLSHSGVVFTNENIIKMKFRAPLNVKLFFDLGIKEKNVNPILCQRNPNTQDFDVSVILPNNGSKFNLRLSASYIDKKTIDYLYTFLIIKSDKAAATENESSFVSCFSNEYDSYIYTPTEKRLKLNKEYDFKIYLKDANLLFANESVDSVAIRFDEKSKNIWTLTYKFKTIGIKSLSAGSSKLEHYSVICEYEVVAD